MNTGGKEYYMKLLRDCFAKFRPRIEAAPSKGGWDPIFNQKTASQYDVIKQRDVVLQQILNEAKCFGIDIEFTDPESEYVSPFDGKTTE